MSFNPFATKLRFVGRGTARELRPARRARRCTCGDALAKQWHLTCPKCWAQVPKTLQDEVWTAYKQAPRSERHFKAMRAVEDFLRTVREMQAEAKLL